MKIDWQELEKGFEKEAFLQDAYKGVKDWATGGLESVARGTADATGKVWAAVPGVQQMQDMNRFSNYMGGGGLMKDLGGVAAVGLPLLLGMQGRKGSGGQPNIHIDLGPTKNILGSAPGQVRSLSSPKMAALLKSGGLGSAMLKGLSAVKNIAAPVKPVASAVSKPLTNLGNPAAGIGKAVAAPAAEMSAVKTMATPVKPVAAPATNVDNPVFGYGTQNAAHMERINLRQAIQNARVFGKKPSYIRPVQEILKRRNLRIDQTIQPGLNTKAANILLDPNTLRTVVLSRMANDTITRIEKNKAQPASPRMLELVSKYPEMQQMLANPDTRKYFENLLTKESQQHTDEKNIYPGS